MITKTYHIITIDITQIIDSTLNLNFLKPFLSNYIELDKMDQIRKQTEMDITNQIGLNRINDDQSGVNGPNQTKVDQIGPK